MEDSRSDGKYRVNRAITAPTVRLIDQDGNAVGIISIKEAQSMATREGLDLVEVAPQATPPVCKISDYGKLKYELQKKKSEA
ncbi:MAG: translation initiation factor IF-3, partial [Holosporaceae bacterium]|nr:translation initiation factor IF-3 [Holosporaceae bacterium]